MGLTYGDRMNDVHIIQLYSEVDNDINIQTNNVMKEETELLLKRQQSIYNILAVVTIVSILITVKYAQN
jgi:hypothetical protein